LYIFCQFRNFNKIPESFFFVCRNSSSYSFVFSCKTRARWSNYLFFSANFVGIKYLKKQIHFGYRVAYGSSAVTPLSYRFFWFEYSWCKPVNYPSFLNFFLYCQDPLVCLVTNFKFLKSLTFIDSNTVKISNHQDYISIRFFIIYEVSIAYFRFVSLSIKGLCKLIHFPWVVVYLLYLLIWYFLSH
jgi:hypothetical protein